MDGPYFKRNFKKREGFSDAALPPKFSDAPAAVIAHSNHIGAACASALASCATPRSRWLLG